MIDRWKTLLYYSLFKNKDDDQKNKIWDSLEKSQAVIEYLDAEETDTSFIAVDYNQLINDKTD